MLLFFLLYSLQTILRLMSTLLLLSLLCIRAVRLDGLLDKCLSAKLCTLRHRFVKLKLLSSISCQSIKTAKDQGKYKKLGTVKHVDRINHVSPNMIEIIISVATPNCIVMLALRKRRRNVKISTSYEWCVCMYVWIRYWTSTYRNMY